MSYEEDRWDATRQSEEEPADTPKFPLGLKRLEDLPWKRRILTRQEIEEDYGDDWHCHDCQIGDRTNWDPEVGCPRYPCRAFKPAACRACPQCGWVA